ncbi:MAG: type II toxin-antitoxin system RelE/ParE family toxin [Elusimicrobia bacterium]|nr:type II toxin-antitoxin system RelE/ParE family toxin [Elusimicrobiota bacterium]
MLRVQFYPSGDNGPVREYLRGLRKDPQRKGASARLGLDLRLLQEEGLASKQIDILRVTGIPGSVWELRRTFEGIRYRIYFCVKRGEVWLLHNLEKKTPKIPKHDLKLIRTRAKEVL